MLNNSDVLIAVISGAYPNTLDKTLDVVRVFSTGRGQLPQEWSWPVFIPGSESVSIIADPGTPRDTGSISRCIMVLC